MACNGSVIVGLKGGASGLWNNIGTGQTSVMPPSNILFSSPLQLVFNNLLLGLGFYFSSVKSPMNPCNLLPTASCGQEFGCLAALYKGPSLFVCFELTVR